jgi:hypothetical protein
MLPSTDGGCVRYVRMPIEVESPEEYGYDNIRYNLSESSIADQKLRFGAGPSSQA